MTQRKRLNKDQWQAHIKAWEASGLSQTAYCQKHGLNDKYFSLRKNRFLKEGAQALPDPSATTVNPVPELMPVKVVSPEPHADVVLLRLPNGIELKLTAGTFRSLDFSMVQSLCQIH